MARRPYTVVIPTKPDPLAKLADNALAKHAADGAASPIPIASVTALTAKVAEAKEQAAIQKELDRNKETYNEERNQRLGILDTQTTVTEGTVIFYITSIRNFLLGQFRGMERKLGDWTFTVNSPKGEVQVPISRNPEKLMKLAAGILKKHNDDAAASILSVFDMTAFQASLDFAVGRQTLANAANRNKEKATQSRNLALGTDKGQNSKTPGTVSYIVRSIRDILLGIYRGQEQKLGDWGFEVNFNTNNNGGAPPTPPPAPGV